MPKVRTDQEIPEEAKICKYCRGWGDPKQKRLGPMRRCMKHSHKTKKPKFVPGNAVACDIFDFFSEKWPGDKTE